MTSDLLHWLLSKFTDARLVQAGVIPWSSPVPVFGNPKTSIVGTLGLNPSNREFVDQYGHELRGEDRRFETLASLRIRRWANAKESHIEKISASCEQYFSNRPYDGWFKKLDLLISLTRASFYLGSASHLDLIPFATESKWGELSTKQKIALLECAGNSLAQTLRDSAIKLLVLNGASVIAQFRSAFGVQLETQEMKDWTLQAKSENPVSGFAYSGVFSTLSGIAFGRSIRVLGFNHNIQSSYGVTNQVVNSIKTWIGKESETALASA